MKPRNLLTGADLVAEDHRRARELGARWCPACLRYTAPAPDLVACSRCCEPYRLPASAGSAVSVLDVRTPDVRVLDVRAPDVRVLDDDDGYHD